MKPPKQTDRAFGLTFAGVFAVIFVVAGVAFQHWLPWAWAWAVGFLAVALILPNMLMPFNRLWRLVGGAVGHVSNHLLLGLFFYLFVTPVGFILRALGKDPMQRSKMPGDGTYWTPVQRQSTADTLDDLF